jgi:hypothetical protein
MVSAYDVPQLEPLTGNAGALSDYGTRYAGVADAISAVARQLDLIANDDVTVGLSVDAMRDETREASAAIRQVLPRYEESAAAIRDYAVVLADAQGRASAAISEIATLRTELYDLYEKRTTLDYEFQDKQYTGTPADMQEIARDQNTNQSRISTREDRLYTVWMNYLDAEGDKSAAADAAARRILPAAFGSNDTILDRIADAWANGIELITMITDWVGEVLYNVIFTVMLLQAALVALALVLVFILPLAIGLSTGWLTIEELIGIALVVLPALAFMIGIVMNIEANSPTPNMTARKPYWGTEVDKGDRTDYAHAFYTNGEIDGMGNTQETVVDITKVVDEYGNVTWRVTLPSTQNWQVGFDWWEQGAANDLGSNLALILTPDQQAAYERMVIEAMQEAGIGPTDPVMLVGFSQGGILAGKLASNPDLPFQVEAIVVGGSPIDHMDIPPSVSVLSFQHTGDIVPQLDGTAATAHPPNWVTVSQAPQPNQEEHGANSYSLTAGQWTPGSAAEQAVVTEQSQFFSDNETSYLYAGAE